MPITASFPRTRVERARGRAGGLAGAVARRASKRVNGTAVRHCVQCCNGRGARSSRTQQSVEVRQGVGRGLLESPTAPVQWVDMVASNVEPFLVGTQEG